MQKKCHYLSTLRTRVLPNYPKWICISYKILPCPSMAYFINILTISLWFFSSFLLHLCKNSFCYFFFFLSLSKNISAGEIVNNCFFFFLFSAIVRFVSFVVIWQIISPTFFFHIWCINIQMRILIIWKILKEDMWTYVCASSRSQFTERSVDFKFCLTSRLY